MAGRRLGALADIPGLLGPRMSRYVDILSVHSGRVTLAVDADFADEVREWVPALRCRAIERGFVIHKITVVPRLAGAAGAP